MELERHDLDELRKKLYRAVDGVLKTYDAGRKRAVEAIAEAVREYRIGQKVKLSKDAKNTGGKIGVIRKLLPKSGMLVLEVEGTQWRIGLGLIEREEQAILGPDGERACKKCQALISAGAESKRAKEMVAGTVAASRNGMCKKCFEESRG